MSANSLVSSPTAPYLQCSHEVICGLIETASCALLGHLPTVVGDTFDVELVVDTLRVLRPAVSEIAMLEGVLHIVHGRWGEAEHTLRELLANVPSFSYARALLAYCQFSKGDDSWRQTAAETLEAESTDEARALVRALHARDDLRNAIRDYRGGEFVPPASCQALDAARLEKAAGAVPAAASGANAGFDMSSFGYLRA